MRRVIIKNCGVNNMYLSVGNSDISDITERTSVVIRAYQRHDSQIWDIKGDYTTSTVSVHSKANNLYALNAKTTTWDCDVYEYHPNNNDNNPEAELTFISTGVTNRYRIQQKNHPSRYLTADADNNVTWATLNNSNYQIWEINTTLIKGCDTAAVIRNGDIETLTATGFQFIGRYLNEKQGIRNGLTTEEATRISNAEMYILSLYETTGNETITELNQTFAIAQAQEAITLASALNQTANTYIFFCIEGKKTLPYTPERVDQYVPGYLAGLNSVFSDSTQNPRNYKWGLYSEAMACKKAKELYPSCHTMKNSMQDDMTINTRMEDWDIHQYTHDISITTSAGNLKIDHDEAMPTTFNLWRY